MIRSRGKRKPRSVGLEHAPFPKVIRYGFGTFERPFCLEHAPFPKVIRYEDHPDRMRIES